MLTFSMIFEFFAIDVGLDIRPALHLAQSPKKLAWEWEED